ncbi:MAG TPA: hypothetical protein VG347_02590 [Verrucomicrobiae bacterium]|nr:hypothetical protein [Verrucomicrobiae bacterium]
MKNSLIYLTPALALAVLDVHAEDAPEHANWFSVGPTFGLRVDARFNHLGNVNSASPGPASGGGLDRTYNDGFVKVDSSGNSGGQTWNWGYQNASQVQGNAIVMHTATSVNGTLNDNQDPQPGFDLAFGHDFGKVWGGRWGLQGAFDFTAVSIHNSQPLTGSSTLINDAFSLNGNAAPDAPYAGSFSGPGQLLGDSPTRTSSTESVLITGQHTLDAQIYVLRAGPYYEFNFGQRWSGRLGGGVVLGVADMKYSFNETLNFGGGSVVNNSGSSEGAEVQGGAYLDAKVLYALSPTTSFFVGAQYEYLGTFSHDAGNEQAQLDISGGVNVLFGFEWAY